MSRGSVLRIKGALMTKYAVNDAEQLSHAGNQGNFFSFATGDELAIEARQERVMANGY